MSTDLHDLRRALADRATLDPLDAEAARARVDAVLATTRVAVGPVRTRPRRPRLVAVGVVAAAVVALVGSAVVATTGTASHPDRTNFAAAVDDPLPLTQWLFTVQPMRLLEHLSVIQYVHADAGRQVAAVLSPQDAATSNRYSAVVELAADPAVLGVATRPADAQSRGDQAWTSPLADQEFGVSGVQLVWTTSSGYTMRVVAGNSVDAQALRNATDVGDGHPVRVPMAVSATWFPAGSQVTSYDFVGVQGVQVVVAVPGQPSLGFDLAASGVYVNNRRPAVAVNPFASGFSTVRSTDEQYPEDPGVQAFTSSRIDLQITPSDVTSGGAPLPDDRVRSLLAGSRFVAMADQQAWFPLADALPTG